MMRINGASKGPILHKSFTDLKIYKFNFFKWDLACLIYSGSGGWEFVKEKFLIILILLCFIEICKLYDLMRKFRFPLINFSKNLE